MIRNRNDQIFLLACSFVLFGLGACGGGNTFLSEAADSDPLPKVIFSAGPANANASNLGSSTTGKHPVLVTLTYTLPTSTVSGATPLLSRQGIKYRHVEYISTSNTLISIAVTPIGGTPTTYGPSPCTSVTCTISFTTVPGPTMIAFTLTDGSSNVLSRFDTTVIVQPATMNTLKFTANPVVKSVTLQLASPTVNAGTSTNDLLTLQAKDIDGKTIVGNANYVDVNGNSVAFTLAVSNSQAGGRGRVTVQGPAYITAPGQAATYAHYDGNWLASSAISVAASSNAVTTLTGVTLLTTPTVSQEFVIPSANSAPFGITLGPDGNLWFTENNTSKIGRVTTGGLFTEFTIPTVASQPNNITLGSDGNLWFTEGNASKIGYVTTLGFFTEFTVPTVNSSPSGIIRSPDGTIWFLEYSQNKIGRVTKSGIFSEFTIPTVNAQPQGMIVGPDGTMWFTEEKTAKIASVTTSGVFREFNVPTALSGPYGITLGPEGNLWFTEYNAGVIGSITTSGVFTEFTIPTAIPAPTGITLGPDGNLWFTEYGTNKIGCVTTSGVFTEYTIPTANSFPVDITLGSDGNLWFVESGTNKIGKFVL